MISVEEYERLRSKVEAIKAKAERARGMFDSAMARLRELGYEDLDEAKGALRSMEADLEKKKAVYDKAVQEFKTRWVDML